MNTRIRRKPRRLVAATLIGAGTMLASACSTGFDGIYDLPLPGGAELGAHPYQITVQFNDVLSLVPHSAVKVNNVPVGTVEAIRLGGTDGWTAEVVLSVNSNVTLPANAVARIRQSSLLGEKFVELAAPADLATDGSDTPQAPVPAGARLHDGSIIPLARTDVGVEIEEIFGALSLLLNGGGIEQLQTISQELSAVMDGSEPEIRSFLAGMNETVSSLDAHRSDITAALDALDRLSATLADRDEQISTALTELSPGLASLTDQRTELVAMLDALDDLSTVAVDTINRSKADMVADLEALAPILRRLAQAGSDLPDALEVLPTFPFTDRVLDVIKGDYLNSFVTIKPGPGFEQPIPPLVPPDDIVTGGGTP